MTLTKHTLARAIHYIREHPDTGPSMLQRRFKIGYAEACRLLDGTHALLDSPGQRDPPGPSSVQDPDDQPTLPGRGVGQ